MLGKGPGGLHTAPTKEENGRVGGEGDKIKFIDLTFERGQVAGFRKGTRMQDVPKNESCWDE